MPLRICAVVTSCFFTSILELPTQNFFWERISYTRDILVSGDISDEQIIYWQENLFSFDVRRLRDVSVMTVQTTLPNFLQLISYFFNLSFCSVRISRVDEITTH